VTWKIKVNFREQEPLSHSSNAILDFNLLFQLVLSEIVDLMKANCWVILKTIECNGVLIPFAYTFLSQKLGNSLKCYPNDTNPPNERLRKSASFYSKIHSNLCMCLCVYWGQIKESYHSNSSHD
jgi:hypothetical protein